MQVEIKGNIIYVQLKHEQLRLLANEKKLIYHAEGNIHNNGIYYSIEIGDTNEIQIAFAGDQLRIFVPGHIALHWIINKDAYLEYILKVGQFNMLKICIDNEVPNSTKKTLLMDHVSDPSMLN